MGMRVGIVALMLLIGFADFPWAQDPPLYGRLVIIKTSRFGAAATGVVKNLGPGKMCAVVVQGTTYAEINPGSIDYGKSSVVTYNVGELNPDAEAEFNLPSSVVRERMPSMYVTGFPCKY